MLKLGINGFGRIGRSLLRAARGNPAGDRRAWPSDARHDPDARRGARHGRQAPTARTARAISDDADVLISGVGCGTDAMRMADRPHGKVPLLPHETEADYADLKYPGVHSFRGGRMAAGLAYKMAGITNPAHELDFVELHDAYTSSEIQTCEDIGLCRYGEGGSFVDSGAPFLPNVEYGLAFSGNQSWPRIPVNPSGGLLACGHPVGATGLMQAVFAFWQLQGTINKHLGDATLQLPDAKRGLIHSHAGTGTYITVSIMEKV